MKHIQVFNQQYGSTVRVRTSFNPCVNMIKDGVYGWFFEGHIDDIWTDYFTETMRENYYLLREFNYHLQQNNSIEGELEGEDGNICNNNESNNEVVKEDKSIQCEIAHFETLSEQIIEDNKVNSVQGNLNNQYNDLNNSEILSLIESNTFVLINNNRWKPITDLRVGDTLITKNGFKTVTEVHNIIATKQENLPMRLIKDTLKKSIPSRNLILHPNCLFLEDENNTQTLISLKDFLKSKKEDEL